MNTKFVVAMAIGCFVLGAAAMQTLHAQAKPPTYAIAVIDIRDADAYKAAAPEVRDRIMKMDAKPLVAAGVAGSSEVLVPEGEKAPSRLLSFGSGLTLKPITSGGPKSARKTSRCCRSMPH